MPNRLAIAEQMIAHYNAQDADAYVALMTDDACEANYRGDVVRDGKEGTRSGLAAAFARWPQNRAEIRDAQAIGELPKTGAGLLRAGQHGSGAAPARDS